MQVPNSWLWYTLLVVVLVVGVISALEKWRPAWQFYLRKSLHIIVIFVAALASMYLVSIWLPIVSWVASIVLWIAIKRGWFEEVVAGEQARKPWGMVYFSVIYAVLTSLPWMLFGPGSHQWLMLSWMNGWSFCTLAFADGMAGIMGRWGTRALGLDRQQVLGIFKLDGERKSWLGFIVFWLISVVVGVFFFEMGEEFLPNAVLVDDVVIPQLVVFGFAVAAVEMVSGKGSDNIFIVVAVWLFAGAMAMGFLGSPHALFLQGTGYLWLYMLLSVCASLVLYRSKILDNTGAVMAWILAFVVVVMAGWSLWPLIVFLGLSSVVGRLRKKHGFSVLGDSKEGKPRDRWQVLANGGLYMGCALLVYLVNMDVASFFGLTMDAGVDEKCALLAFYTLSASCADTLSSEVGQWIGGMPRSIITGKQIPKGVSGGVTFAGFVGAVIGAVSIGVCIYFNDWIELKKALDWSETQIFLSVVSLGIVGTIIDSTIGDLFQGKYTQSDGLLSDVPDKENLLIAQGVIWVTNDRVNAMTGFVTLLLGGLILF